MARIITLTPNPALDYALETEKAEPNRKLLCENASTHPGGGGINVSRAAMRLGAETFAIYTAGGVYGEALENAVDDEAIPNRNVAIAGETRLAFHIRERATGDEYRFNLRGPQMTGKEAASLLALLRDEAGAGDFIVGSGSLPPGAPDDFWAQAGLIAHERNARFLLDSSAGVPAALETGLYLLRTNKHEFAALAGRSLAWPEETEAFAREFVKQRNIEKFVITFGGGGAMLAASDRVFRAPSLPVKIISAVGAGDSFMGALCVALMRGDNDQDALRFAMAAAVATLTTPGTELFDADEVARIFSAEI